MDEAIKYLCANHFHRRLWLPENAIHQRLRVTYSTTSNFFDTTLPVILFCGPMFGSRWNSAFIDNLATTSGVRVISIDRPGMGGSTQVPLNIRVKVWLETVPALLAALEVKNVSLVSHSAGTIYAMNTMYLQRDILDPQHPYVAFIAPWVQNEHSQATLMKLASAVPASWIDSWDRVNRFIAGNVVPPVAWSGGILSSVSSMFQSGAGDSGDVTPGERYGVSEEVGKCIEKLQMKWCLAESSTAGNEEALLTLKKGGAGNWGICEDYEGFVQVCTQQEQQQRGAHPNPPKLQVQTYFAQSDVMIGEGGRQYFEQCWKQDGVAEAMEFDSVVMAGTNHDSALVDLKKGALRPVFERVAKARAQAQE